MKLKNFDINEILTSPWALWLISIVSAVIMWVYVTGIDESEYITRKFSCPLEYRGLDSQAILRGRLSEVDIEIRGPEVSVTRLDYNSIRAFVDARNLLPGKKYTLNISVEYPSNITLLSCFPSQATLDIVRQVTRLMTVETELPQNIPEGMYVEGVAIVPKEVGVKGAEDDVAKVGRLRVTPTIEELQEGNELLMAVKMVQSEPFEGSVAIEPAQVRFHGSLVRGLPRKRIPVNVRLAGKLDEDYQVRSVLTDPSEIQIEGKAEDIAKIDGADTEVIDISSMTADSVVVSPLRQPEIEGVSIVNASSVKVTIQLSEARAEKMIMNVPVEIRGADSSANWVCSPAAVTVAIEGRPSLIRDFDPQIAGLKAYADMSNIFMSSVTLPVRTEILSSDKFRVVRVEPQNVIVSSLESK